MATPNPYATYEKDGLNALLKLCKAMCRLIQEWEPVIREKYKDNVAIMALLDVNLELCSLLPDATAAFEALSLVTTPPSDTSEETVGYDPSAPAPVPPDFT